MPFNRSAFTFYHILSPFTARNADVIMKMKNENIKIDVRHKDLDILFQQAFFQTSFSDGFRVFKIYVTFDFLLW